MTSNKKPIFRRVTDQELEELMATRTPNLLRGVVQAPPVTKQELQARLGAQDLLCLRTIRGHPCWSVTTLGTQLGLSNDDHNSRLNGLADAGYVEKYRVNLGKIRPVLSRLTTKGYAALKETPLKRNLNVSAEHWFWQRQYHTYKKDQGFTARIEYKGADVAYEHPTNTWNSFQVAMTPTNEARNVRRDLTNFAHVTVACRAVPVRNKVQRMLATILSEDEWKKVDILLLSELPFVPRLIKQTRGEA